MAFGTFILTDVFRVLKDTMKVRRWVVYWLLVKRMWWTLVGSKESLNGRSGQLRLSVSGSRSDRVRSDSIPLTYLKLGV